MNVFEQVAICHEIQEVMHNESISEEYLSTLIAPGHDLGEAGLKEGVDYVIAGTVPLEVQRVSYFVSLCGVRLHEATDAEMAYREGEKYEFATEVWTQMLGQVVPINEQAVGRIIRSDWTVIDLTESGKRLYQKQDECCVKHNAHPDKSLH